MLLLDISPLVFIYTYPSNSYNNRYGFNIDITFLNNNDRKEKKGDVENVFFFCGKLLTNERKFYLQFKAVCLYIMGLLCNNTVPVNVCSCLTPLCWKVCNIIIIFFMTEIHDNG